MRSQNPNLSLIELLYMSHYIKGYNFKRTLFVVGYTDIYSNDLQKRIKIAEIVSPLLQLLYTVR